MRREQQTNKLLDVHNDQEMRNYRVPMYTADLRYEMQDGVSVQRADSKSKKDGHERLIAGALREGEEDGAQYSAQTDNQRC